MSFPFGVMLLDLEINTKISQGKLEGTSPNNKDDIPILSYANDLIVSKATLNNC